MPATKPRRSAKRSVLLLVGLALGLAGLASGPLSCGTDSSKEAAGGSDSEAAETAAAEPVLLNIGFVDETQKRSLSGEFLVKTPRGNRWRPDPLEGAQETRAFQEYSVGKIRKLHLYPEGAEGPRLSVPFTMKPDMNSTLAQSRTDILVYDDSIVVRGPAVPGGRRSYDRPPSGGTSESDSGSSGPSVSGRR